METNGSNESYKMDEKQQSSDASESEPRIDGELVLRDVMHIICEHLDSKDLSCVAQVCQSWREEVSRQMNRKHFEIKVWPGSCIDDLSFVASNYVNNKPHVTLLFPSSGFVYQIILRDDGFTYYRDDYLFPNLDLERETLRAYQKQFPNKLIVIAAYESTLDKNFIPSLPLVDDNIPHAILSLSPPLSSNKALNIKEGWVLESEYHGYNNSVFSSMIENLLDDNTESKSALLLLFVGNEHVEFDESWASGEFVPLFKSIKSRFPEKSITLWGFATPYRIYASDYNHDTNFLEQKALALFGLKLSGPNVKTWTKMISVNITKTKVFKELKSFRKEVNLKQFSLGFITFPSKPPSNYHDYDKHPLVFCNDYHRTLNYVKKVFPEVPFLGSRFLDDGRYFSLVATPEDDENILRLKVISILIVTY